MATETAATTEARASVKYLHVSPYKVRPVLDLIRGMSAEDAERVLQLTPRDAAGDILKVLESAIANAEHNNHIPVDELYVATCYCDEGPTRASGRARARGRSFKIRKRSSHITVVLARFAERDLEMRRRKAEAAGTGRGASQRKRSERVRASRRPAAEEHDHDHDHDHEVETVEEPTIETVETTAIVEAAGTTGEQMVSDSEDGE